LGVKQPRREADHSPPSSAEVREYVELHLHSSNTPSLPLTDSLLREIPLSSYALSPTMLPLLETLFKAPDLQQRYDGESSRWDKAQAFFYAQFHVIPSILQHNKLG